MGEMWNGSVRLQLLLATAVIALGGCGSIADEEATGTLLEGGSSAAVSGGSAVEDPGGEAPIAPFNPGFRLGEEFANDDGTFRRLIMPDDYEGIYSPDIVSEADVGVSADELEEALLLTGRFAAEELATSELAFDYSVGGAEAWFDEHEDLFLYPDRARTGLLTTGEPNQSLALLYTDNGWDRGKPERFGRFQNLSVELVALEEEGDQLTISHLVAFDARVWGPGGVEGAFIEKTLLHATYTVEKVDGQWKIADYETIWDTRY